MPGQIMQRHLNKQDRLWVMLRNEHSQQVRADIAELVAEAWLGYVPGEMELLFKWKENDPSANNLLLVCKTKEQLEEVQRTQGVIWKTYEEANPVGAEKEETAAELEQRALFEQDLIDG